MIENLKDLQKLFKLCRAQGITDLKINGIEVSFGNLPTEHLSSDSDYVPGEIVDPYSKFPTGELTPEQLAFYSAGGHPDNDPLNKEAI